MGSSMNRAFRLLTLYVAVSLLGSPAYASGISLIQPPLVQAGVDSLPRIDEPRTAPTLEINAILSNADARLQKLIDKCYKDANYSKDAYWKRSVAVTFVGSRYLSLIEDDENFCGGAHGASWTVAWNFNIRTGQLLDWRHLLPRQLVASSTTRQPWDGIDVPVIQSPALAEQYFRLWPFAPHPRGHDADWSMCRSYLEGLDIFVLWLTATPPGLAMRPAALPQATNLCGLSVTVPVSRLAELGVNATVLTEIRNGVPPQGRSAE